jgi:hypothetical protein
MTPPVTQIAGLVYLGDRPLTLAQAEALRDDIAADFIIACGVWRDAKEAHRALDAERAFFVRERLSGQENALRRAIEAAKDHRRALGWKDLYAADDRRVDVTGDDD